MNRWPWYSFSVIVRVKLFLLLLQDRKLLLKAGGQLSSKKFQVATLDLDYCTCIPDNRIRILGQS